MEKFFEGHISKAAVSGNIAAASFSGRLNASSGNGGNDYENLSNKPRINGVVLSGDKSFEELGFPDIPDMSGYAKLADIPSSLPARGGDADTVGGHTVLTDVPENAVFTDTVPDLSGYAKIADIPSSLPAKGGDADTVGGHTVLADVPENAVFTDTVPDLSGYMKKNETITIGNVFTPFPRQVDTNGKIVYSEYTRKNSDGTADKLFRIMGDPDAPSYSDFQAHYDGQNVIWYFNGTGLGVSAKIGGKTVITEATAAMQEFGGTPKLSDGVKTDVAVSFNPKIVLLFNSGRIITGGYAIAMGTKKFTVTPSSVSTMGTATPGYIAFG